MRLLVTFHTTFNVLKLEASAGKRGIPGRIGPVPRKYSANCGLCWLGPVETRSSVEALIEEQDVEIDRIYEIE